MGLGIDWLWSMRESGQEQVLASSMQSDGQTGPFPETLNIGRETGLMEKS